MARQAKVKNWTPDKNLHIIRMSPENIINQIKNKREGVYYYIDDDGNKVRMGGIYDPIKGEIVFDSTHCSLYMVVDEDSSNSGLSYTAIFVGIAVAVVAAIAVAIMLYVRKR